jgi:hypothetical protein
MTDNPAWQKVLDALPESLHKVVLPALQEWDNNVQERFAELHKEYEAYKPYEPFIKNNIAADFAWQSVVFADELQREPAKVAAQINEAFELGYVDKTTHEQALASAASNEPSVDDDDIFSEGKVDLTKIPEFMTMKQTLDALQKARDEETQSEQEQREIDEFNTELDALEAEVTGKGQPFNRMFVTALMAQGVSKEDSVKQFHTLLAVKPDEKTDEGTSIPAVVTMGNGGTVGGGQPDGSVNWNSMKTSEFNENVAKALEAMQSGS